MHAPEGYRERPAAVPDAVVWTRGVPTGTDLPVLPDGCMDLLVIEGRLSVAGPDTRAYRPPPGLSTQIAGIRFHPGVAPTLLGVPAHELRDGRADLADLWSPADLRHAIELLERAPTPALGLERIACWRSAERDPADPLLRPIATALGAGASVAATADALGLNPRRLHRLSLNAFGYGPKTLVRILRMQRALALGRDGVALAEIAARAGYADQAHLSREVRELSGLSPSELMSRPA